MRIVDGLIYQLSNKEFTKISTNVEGLYLFYRPDNEKIDIVLLFHAPSGYELSAEEYPAILNSIKDKFTSGGFETIHLLSIIFTRAPERSRKYCLEQDDHWIVDLNERRLIIFDNQSADYEGLRQDIEYLLENDRFSTDMHIERERIPRNGDHVGISHSRKKGWISLFNTILIAINIIVFLLVNHTSFFGETETLMKQGALSWRHIKEGGEYYRLLTSMFLHSDFAHLINNMLILFFVGDNLERAAGKLRFLMFYFGSGIIAGITSISYNMIKDEYVLSVGASGAIFGVVGAMLYILVINKGRLEDISSRQILLFTIFSLYGGVTSVSIDNAAHIGGFIAGLILALLMYRRKRIKKIQE